MLYPALFLENKGHLEFIEAVAHHPVGFKNNVQILLAGNGRLEGLIREKLDKYSLHSVFRLIGFQKNLSRWYEECDIVLLPSKNEAFGYVILEAMSFAKPVVATRIGGISELVEDTINGWLVDPRRLDKVVDILNECYSSEVKLKEMGRQGQLVLQTKFSMQNMIEQTADLYNSL